MAGDVNTYELGNVIVLSGEFVDTATGTSVDPDTVVFRIRTPDGAMTECQYPANVVRDATGKYHVDWPAITPGRYVYRFFSTGSAMASRDRVFVVQPAGV